MTDKRTAAAHEKSCTGTEHGTDLVECVREAQQRSGPGNYHDGYQQVSGEVTTVDPAHLGAQVRGTLQCRVRLRRPESFAIRPPSLLVRSVYCSTTAKPEQ